MAEVLQMEAAGMDAITVAQRFKVLLNFFSKPCFFIILTQIYSTDVT